MALTTVVTASRVQRWESNFYLEYQRQHEFAPLMGKSENAPFQLIERLTKEAGDTINVPLVVRLTNNPVLGDDVLEGSEEAMGNFNHPVNINQRRWAVRRGDFEQQRTVIDLLEAARMNLKLRVMIDIESEIIRALQSPVVDGDTAYANATEGQKDTWVAAQNPATGNQRVLFGALFSNYVTSDHSASLLNVDSVADTFSTDILSIMRRGAKAVDPHMRPTRIKNGTEWFIALAGQNAFRDIEIDIETHQEQAMMRGMENPLWTSGDIQWRGTVVKEIEAIADIAGVGNSGIDVAPVFLVGAQAIAIAFGKRTFVRAKSFDYGNQSGVAIGEIRGIEKPSFNNVQHGVFTGYMSGEPDS